MDFPENKGDFFSSATFWGPGDPCESEQDVPNTWTPSLGWKGGAATKSSKQTIFFENLHLVESACPWLLFALTVMEFDFVLDSKLKTTSSKLIGILSKKNVVLYLRMKGEMFHPSRAAAVQGTSSNDANATATSGSSAWTNWKSNSNNEWWERWDAFFWCQKMSWLQVANTFEMVEKCIYIIYIYINILSVRHKKSWINFGKLGIFGNIIFLFSWHRWNVASRGDLSDTGPDTRPRTNLLMRWK